MASETGRAGKAGGPRRMAARRRGAAHGDRERAEARAQADAQARELFARPVHDYLHEVTGRPVAVLRAGLGVPLGGLGLDALQDSGSGISVTTVDEDRPAARAAAARAAAASGVMAMLGDLRTIPLPPRSFDIVYCAFLLDRIAHAALVLDRFVAALRPGGLLLLRVRDRDCAASALDRHLPAAVRKALWARLHPGEPGPFPPIYDPLASERGIGAYALSHGLVIVRREKARTPPGPPGRLASAVSAGQGLIARLSRGRLTDAHDELRYVIRKPEDRFARLV